MPRIAVRRDHDVRLNPTSVHASAHTTRDAEEATRYTVHPEEPEAVWQRPTNLDAPVPRPGMVQRWVRDGTYDPKDVPHFMRKVREGWSPRDPATVPHASRHFTVGKAANDSSCIRVGGMVLMEMPDRVARARNNAVRDAVERLSRAVPESVEALNGRGQFSAVRQDDQVRVTTGREPETMVD